MADRENKVLRGFLRLSTTERENFIKELNEYQTGTITKRLQIEREVEYKSSVGPKNTICDCCGR